MKISPKQTVIAAATAAVVMSASAAHAVTIDFEDIFLLDAPGGNPTGNPLAQTPGDDITYGSPGETILGPTQQSSRGFNFGWVVTGIPPSTPIIFLTHGHLANAALIDSGGNWRASGTGAYLVTDDTQDAATGNFLTISPIDGIAFSIQSFDVAEVFSNTSSAQTISVTGFLDDGDAIADLFLTDVTLIGEDFGSPAASTTAFQTVTFGPEWTGLSSVVFDGNGSTDAQRDYFAIDNILVNEPVVDPRDPDDRNDQDDLPDPGDPNDRDGGNGATGVPEPSSLALFGVAAIAFGWVSRGRRAPRCGNIA